LWARETVNDSNNVEIAAKVRSETANHAQGQAINGVIAANRAAVALFNDEPRG